MRAEENGDDKGDAARPARAPPDKMHLGPIMTGEVAPSPRVHALKRAREEMVAVREEILGAIAGVPDERLLRPPPGGGWSVAEVLDHLGTAERKLVKGLVKVERGELIRLPRRVWYYRLPMAPFFWNLKFRAPGRIRPRPRSELVPSEVLAGLAASRRDFLACADRLGPEGFSRLLFPHFILGRFTGLAWFRFVTRHERRHLAQIRRVLAAV